MILAPASEMFHNAVNGKNPGLPQGSPLLNMRHFQGVSTTPTDLAAKDTASWH